MGPMGIAQRAKSGELVKVALSSDGYKAASDRLSAAIAKKDAEWERKSDAEKIAYALLLAAR